MYDKRAVRISPDCSYIGKGGDPAMTRPLIVLTGPTAVGKTRLSIQLAKQTRADIISADSMQVYRGMDIGTAKIKPEETEGVRHYLIDEIDPSEEFHVVRFQELALRYMEEIYAAGRIPLIAGGTGFYIQSVLYRINFTENDADRTYRSWLTELAAGHGAAFLHDMLRKIDPASAEAIHENNIKRVIRALEYYKQTGEPISRHNEEQRRNASPYRFAYFVLNENREQLYERINRRVDQMLSDGLVEEVASLKGRGLTPDMVSMQGLGYKQILAYLDGRMTLAGAVDAIKKETRHFAKRQLTWFKREQDVIWINKNDYDYDEDRMLEAMLSILREKGIIPQKKA